MTGGYLEGEVVIYFLFVRDQGVGEVRDILWRGLGSFFMVDQLGWKTSCFCKNVLCGRNGHIYKERNEAQNPGCVISILVSFLNYY